MKNEVKQNSSTGDDCSMDNTEDVIELNQDMKNLESDLQTRIESLLSELTTLQTKKKMLMTDIQALERLPETSPTKIRRAVSLSHRYNSMTRQMMGPSTFESSSEEDL